MSKAAKKQEEQEWSIEEPKLDNARKLRGIGFIDPEAYKEAIKNARKKLETPLAAAMPCKMGTRKRFFKELRETMASGLTHTGKPSMLVLSKLTNLQGCVWNLVFREIMTIASQRKGSTH